jgi:RNA polymerase sigma-70 factor (ECF subfamily)
VADILETDWNEAGCVARVRQGDEDAARELMQRLHPLVAKLVRSHLPRRTSEEDLVQIVFTKVFSKLDQFSGTVPLPHWVSRVAVNTCLNQLDHERVRPEVRWADLSEDEEAVLQNLARTEADLPGSQAGAARELVERMLAGLAPEDRLVVTLLHLEERTVEEVSALTGWSQTLVKVRAFRARQRMKRAMKTWMREERP